MDARTELDSERGADAGPAAPAFTPREMQVLYLVACGRSCKQMAAALHISMCTVDVYRRRLFARLGVRNAVALQRHAILSGWLRLT
nr:helix-turn-helix transcriptional regulator [Solimonas terrae]